METRPYSPSGSALARLGKKIYFDKNLSSTRQQSCASCHDPESGFTDPDKHHPTSLGTDGVSFGKRNSPTLSYVSHVPDFEMAPNVNPFLSLTKAAQNNPSVPLFELSLLELLTLLNQNLVVTDQSFGGLFLDGRADSLEEQAIIPFFEESEMALTSVNQLVSRLRWSRYSWQFRRLFGFGVFYDGERTLKAVGKALAAFQRTTLFSPFNSKFDRVMEGRDTFTESESRGHTLFNTTAGCFFCHTSPQEGKEVFSDFLYHNIGTPKNYTMLNNIGDPDFIDRGRAEISGNPVEEGMFRTPTLRNVAKTAPYMHNGVFDSLHDVVSFYNTRDTVFESELRTGFTTPHPLMGNLNLTEQDIDDIVSFLNTLSDD